MKKSRDLLLSLLTAAVCLIPQPAVAFGLEAAVGYWWQNPSGDIQFKGDRLDVEDDFGYETEARPFGRIRVDLPAFLPNIYLMATPMEFEESATRNVTFTFGDQTFSAGVPFGSKIKLDQYDIALFYSLPFLREATLGKLNADLGVNVKVIDLEAVVSQSLAGVSASQSATVPVPMLYAGLQLAPVERFGIEAEGRGIAFSSNHYVDLIGRVKVKLIGPLFGAAGYRYQDIEFDVQDVLGSFQFQGPFVEVGVRF
ncbi:MAG: TIGR04219 family outer membrane beta-barrel protein [Candidatus Methylomirabilia bacterium]